MKDIPAHAATFYDAIIGSLGYSRTCSFDDAIGYGVEGGGDKFAIKTCDDNVTVPGFHVAFSAPYRKSVDAFYQAAIANGGIGHGPAGLRENYGPHYYAAYVSDVDGYYIEAVINILQPSGSLDYSS